MSAAIGDITNSKDDILKYEFVEMVKNGLDNKFLEERIMKKTDQQQQQILRQQF